MNDFFVSHFIKKFILSSYPSLNIEIIYNNDEDECYFVKIDNKQTYYSDDYQKLIVSLKRSLWARNINNYYFIYEEQQPDVSLFENIKSDVSIRQDFTIVTAESYIIPAITSISDGNILVA